MDLTHFLCRAKSEAICPCIYCFLFSCLLGLINTSMISVVRLETKRHMPPQSVSTLDPPKSESFASSLVVLANISSFSLPFCLSVWNINYRDM